MKTAKEQIEKELETSSIHLDKVKVQRRRLEEEEAELEEVVEALKIVLAALFAD